MEMVLSVVDRRDRTPSEIKREAESSDHFENNPSPVHIVQTPRMIQNTTAANV